MSADRRRRMIRRRNRKLNVARQCELVGMSRRAGITGHAVRVSGIGL